MRAKKNEKKIKKIFYTIWGYQTLADIYTNQFFSERAKVCNENFQRIRVDF